MDAAKITIEETLGMLHYTPGLPTASGSISNLQKALRDIGYTVDRSSIRLSLQAQDPYTIHRLAPKHLTAEPRVYVPGIDAQWAADHCDMSNIAKHNDGVRYMLRVIDAFSKFAWAQPVRLKSGQHVTEAFKKSKNLVKQCTKSRKIRNRSWKGTLQSEFSTFA